MTQPPAVSGFETPQLARLIASLQSTPTGNHLLLGAFVVAWYGLTDPTDVIKQPPDGTLVLWEDALGVRYLATYARVSGWKEVILPIQEVG